ncbi:uncharacterized protein LOC119107194 [Pollicipes pollicipes]|uniref:uncharacterized protein LOC119107194 n=1 Tax=Pollicipes pollicipes TaxID=41117 RepID=UPI001884B9E6|nr:uncharacterized protein LOC119107194 [Pollicipes pollicipes]
MAAKVLNRDPFCSGYIDSFGTWNNGFACPKLEEEPMFCCGTSTYRYCCTDGGETDPVAVNPSVPLVLGVVFGTLITVVLVVIALCLLWRSCRAYKKQRGAGGPAYRMCSSSTSGGVANMYSYSSASLGRRDGRSGRQELENMLQDVDEVAVTRQSRSSNLNNTLTTFTSDCSNRVSSTDSVGTSSVSTMTDSERQLFIEQAPSLPPPYQLDCDLGVPKDKSRVAPSPLLFSLAAASASTAEPRGLPYDGDLCASTKL